MLQAQFEVIEPAFAKLALGNVHLDVLWSGARWLEGPAYFAASRRLVFSDIPNNRMMQFNEADGSVSVFRQPANNSNGNTRDAEGRLVSCEHLTRRVTRTEHNGEVTVIADRYNGKRLNSPNDVVVHPDGGIWFTDPTYGIDTDYEGEAAAEEIGSSNVYRVDPKTGAVEAMITDMVRPNGLAFAPDYASLYVADTGVSHVENGPRHMRRFRMSTDGASIAGGGEVFATCTEGLFDGFRFDEAGHIWTSAADGVHCLAPDGTLIGKIKIPEVVANVAWGNGPKRNRLYICGTRTLYAQYLGVRGMAYPG